MPKYEIGAYQRIAGTLSSEEIERIINLVLEKRHILYVTYFGENHKKVRCIRRYMRATEAESWYSYFVSEGDQLADYMCFSYMVPDYNYEKKMIEPYDLQNSVIRLSNAVENIKGTLANLKAEDTVKVYLSEAPGDIANFGGPLECSFCEWLTDLNGWEKQ